MLAGAPVGSAGFAAKSGWINEEIFVKYLEHFIQITKCSAENPVLLVMDNHASDISLTGSLIGRKHEIVMVVNVIYVPCRWFSCFCPFSKVTVNVLDIIIVWKLWCLPPHLIDCHL